MKLVLIVAALLCIAAVSVKAAPNTHQAGERPPRADTTHGVTYNRDSPDPSVGWHWENGMRTCHYDCDNPQIPGSGYTCRNVNVMGMPMTDCSRQYP
jgi:hypothetical protein